MKTIETENILLQRNGINESTSVDINSSNDFVADHTTLSRGVFDIETLLTDDTTKSHILILSKYLNLLSSMNNKSSTTKDKVLPVVEDNGKEKITKENLLKAISYIVTTMFNTFPEESL